jgi:hypothetical protein
MSFSHERKVRHTIAKESLSIEYQKGGQAVWKEAYHFDNSRVPVPDSQVMLSVVPVDDHDAQVITRNLYKVGTRMNMIINRNR